MRDVFLKGDTLRNAAVQEQVNVDHVNVLGRLGDLQAEVVETRRALAHVEASLQEKIQAGMELILRNIGVTGVPATGGVGPLTVAPEAGAAQDAAPTTPTNAVSVSIQPEPIFADSKLFAWPSDCFAAYHESFHGIGPASRVLASKGVHPPELEPYQVLEQDSPCRVQHRSARQERGSLGRRRHHWEPSPGSTCGVWYSTETRPQRC